MNTPIRILHLEDSERDAELIHDHLETGGLACEVTLVGNREAFANALATRVHQLVLCDYNLPDYDGRSALELVTRTLPGLPVILISGTLADEEAVVCLRSGATDYILKEKLDRLVPSVKRALREVEERRARRQAEAALRESEGRYRSLVETCFDWVWEVDAEGYYTYASPKVKELLGYEPGEVLGRTPFDLMPLDEARRMGRLFREIAARREAFTALENLNLHRDGRLVVLETSGTPILGPDGEFKGYRGMDRDVTERKRAEAALKDSEAEFRAMFELASIGLAEADVQTGRWLRVNRRLCEISGYTAAELLELTIADVVYPDDRAANQAALQRLAGSESPDYHGETRFVRKDRAVVWVNVHMTVLRDTSGTRLHARAAVEDITARKQAEAELSRLVTAVEQTREIIFITDAQPRILYVNPAFQKVTGYSRAEAMGRNPRLLQSGKHDAQFYRQMWSMLRRGEVWSGRLTNKRKDGTLYEELTTISPVRNAAGQITNYVAVKHDMTKEVQLEAQLRQTQKLEAIGQLAGGVAHDFNNILAAILMQLSFLSQDAALDDRRREDLDELIAEAKRGASLVRQLLLFSRKQVMQQVIVELNSLVGNLLKMLDRLLGEHIELRFSSPPEPMVMEADPGMIEQVVMNLVVNARDAMPEGGILTISLARVDVDHAHVERLPAAREGSWLRLSVQDTGHGMDEATQQRIFEPFFTTKDAGKGTGLGLATVHGIVEQHRGWIEVESRVGAGTTFHIYLWPAAKVEETVAGQNGKSVLLGGTETLLVVEDERMLRVGMAAFLRQRGYQVLEAQDGEEALKQWEAHNRKIDVLISDMVMPGGISGLELTRRLRAKQPGLIAIINSGYSLDLPSHGNLAVENVVYLPKPCEGPVLAEAVRKCLDEKRASPAE